MSPPLLLLRDVGVQFDGLVAVQAFTLAVQHGELQGLIGPNGAGKTTVFNAITGLVEVSNGSITLEGRELTRRRTDQIAQLGIARTFQNIRLLASLDVLDNVLVATHLHRRSTWVGGCLRLPGYRREDRARREACLALLERVGLAHRVHARAGSLPYGEQRRLEIARALATRPRLLLLDEPAAGMNPRETLSLMELIQALQEDLELTILLIEHDMRVVMGICRAIRVMDHGVSIADGDPQAIRTDPRVIEAYLGTGLTGGREEIG